MEDKEIVALYFARSECAIQETDKKYGQYCFHIAYNILAGRQDAEEGVNDTYLTAWNSIPPQRPDSLRAFLGKIVRHISLDRWRKNNAAKRGGGEVPLALEELEECISTDVSAEQEMEWAMFRQCFCRFLQGLQSDERAIFVSRYWLLNSVKDISEKTGLSESNVKTRLFRTRSKLKKYLSEEVFYEGI